MWSSAGHEQIAEYLIELVAADEDDRLVARKLASIESIARLGHQVTRGDIMGICRLILQCCGSASESGAMVARVCARFADDDQAAIIAGLSLHELVAVVRPVLGIRTGC
jgi:hypothetical protein